MRRVPVREILDFLKNEQTEVSYQGRDDVEICSMSNLQDLTDNSICWIKNRSFAADAILERLKELGQAVVVCPFSIDGANCIVTDYPKGVFFKVLNHFFSCNFEHTISPRAVVESDNIGNNVHIGPHCHIGKNVAIGDNTIIHSNVVIECPCVIGRDCEIFSGVVIGTDGFGYYVEDGVPHREQHYRGVVIGDNVDIGTNTCIDRGLLTDTVIGNNVKIDNLCQIAHNVRIEDNCLVTAGTLLCGSSVIRQEAYLAPGSVVLNQIKVGQNATVGVNSVATYNVKDGITVFGTPAMRITPRL